MSGNVWRLVVDSWPTENGKSFASQGFDYWADVVDRLEEKKPLPEWLPDDLESWLGDGETYPVIDKGFAIIDSDPPDYASGYEGFSRHLMSVPTAPTRRYFSQGALTGRLKDLLAWGCVAHLERAPIGDWETIA